MQEFTKKRLKMQHFSLHRNALSVIVVVVIVVVVVVSCNCSILVALLFFV